MAVLFVLIVFVVALVFVLQAAVQIVPQQQAWVVERLGRYDRTLKAGLNLIVPFLDRVPRHYKQDLKEQVVAIAEQDCITKDNVLIKVDAVLYYQILDPVKASYGIADPLHGSAGAGLSYGIAGAGPRSGVVQLAQTTVRSEIGKIDLDRTFEERPAINTHIVGEIDKASAAWGIKVLRYEIKNITPPQDIRSAMERQMRAEREKRAAILESEGKRDALINTAEGRKQEEIKASEAHKQREINEADGKAAAIRAIATATAAGIKEVASAIQAPGGLDAVRLRVAEAYLLEFGKLAKENNTIILPANVSDVASMIALAMGVIRDQKEVESGTAAAIPVRS